MMTMAQCKATFTENMPSLLIYERPSEENYAMRLVDEWITDIAASMLF